MLIFSNGHLDSDSMNIKLFIDPSEHHNTYQSSTIFQSSLHNIKQ